MGFLKFVAESSETESGVSRSELTLNGERAIERLAFLGVPLSVKGAIPPTEARALRSRGAAYRRYQRTTSAFFPLPPRKAAEA